VGLFADRPKISPNFYAHIMNAHGFVLAMGLGRIMLCC